MSQRTCSMCEQPVQLMSDNPYHVDTGLHITIHTGYGMFADGLAQGLITCHACSIRLLSLFPQSVRNHYRGGHDISTCTGCEYNDFSSDDFTPSLEDILGQDNMSAPAMLLTETNQSEQQERDDQCSSHSHQHLA